jgi:hypothetical protein
LRWHNSGENLSSHSYLRSAAVSKEELFSAIPELAGGAMTLDKTRLVKK